MNRVTFLLSVAFLAGCSKKAPESAAPADAGVTQTSAAVDAGPSKTTEADSGDPVLGVLGSGTGAGVKSRTDERFARLGLMDKMAVEKLDRPKDALKVETVFDAIESKLKSPVTRRRQVLAFGVKAGYCELGDVEPAITVCVCEYDDDQSLADGRAPARALKIPNREIVEVKHSTVAVQRADPKPEANAKANQIKDLVKTL